MLIQHGRPEPGKDNRQPAHKGGGVNAQLSQPILAAVQVHAGQSRRHDHKQQGQQQCGEGAKQPLRCGVLPRRVQPLPILPGMQRQQQRQGQTRDSHQLKEPVPGIGRVSHADGGKDCLPAPKEVAKLHQHKQKEQSVQRPQNNGGFNAANGKSRQSFFRCLARRCRGEKDAQAAARKAGRHNNPGAAHPQCS